MSKKKNKKFNNPFKDSNWENPGKTIEEAKNNMKRKINKYKIKDLMKNTDFEAQREDEVLSKWQGKELMDIKSRSESVYNVSEKDFDLILEATQQAEEIKFSESPLPKEYIEWLSKQKGVDNRGVKGESIFFDDDELEFLENQKRDKTCENLKSKFWGEDIIPNHPENIEDCILPKEEIVRDDVDYAYFDIDKLNYAMSQKGITMPKFNSFEEFEEWLDSDCEDEDYE